MTILKLSCLAIVLGLAIQPVGAEWNAGQCKPAGACDTFGCQPCRLVCCLEVSTDEVEKSCWETECEAVCIPPVRCPLFNLFRKDDCEPCDQTFLGRLTNSSQCGRVRVVKKLKSVSYDCEETTYKWTVKSLRTGSQKRCDAIGPIGDCAPASY